MKICVIGGGLSGSVAILALHRLGLSPIWITTPRGHELKKQKWPEAIDFQGLSLLSEVTKASEFYKNLIYPKDFEHTCWGSNELLSKTDYRAKKQTGGTQLINKSGLTRLLFEYAQEYCQPIVSRVSKVESNSSLWRIIINHEESIDANCIIFANGRNTTLQRNLCSINRVDTLQAHHWILHQNNDHSKFIDTGSLIEACPDGWWYAATLGQQSISLIFFSDPHKTHKSHWTSSYLRHCLNKTIHLKNWIKQSQWKQFNRPLIFHTHCQHLSQYAECKKSNAKQIWLSIGDAAIQHDPLSSFGSTNGIWSAIKAAECIKTTVTKNDRTGINTFNELMHRLNSTMANQRLAIYKNERRFADMHFWNKRHKQRK